MSSLSKRENFKIFIDGCNQDTLKEFLVTRKDTLISLAQDEILHCLDIQDFIVSFIKEEDFFEFMTHYYIFEKKEKEKKDLECKKNNQKFETLTKHGNAVFFMIDPLTMRFTFSKGKGLKKLGLQQDEVVGKLVSDCYGDNESIMKGIRQAAKGKERRGKIDIGQIYFDVNFTPVFDKHGFVREVVGMAFDTSKHKALQIKLKEANLTKDKFFSIIAHDLRSPFGAILGFLELLKDNLKTLSMEEIKERIDLIDMSATRSYNLLVRLLEWARSQSSVALFNPELFDIYQESTEQIKLLEETAKNKNIVLENSIPISTKIYADKRMINSIFRNLISNAIKFTGNQENTGKITLSLESLPDNLLFSITDNGVGMEPEQKEDLFQIDKICSTKGTAKEQGSGLGLLLCKEFVSKHDGKIRVEKSEPGKGTTIQFSIPIISL